MTRKWPLLSVLVLCLSMHAAASEAAAAAKPQAMIVCDPGATVQELLAAQELRRYVYLRTGALMPVEQREALPEGVDAIVVANKDRALVGALTADAGIKAILADLAPQQYLLRTVPRQGQRVLLIGGGDSIGTLYGAYRLAEHLGVRFFLHGDVVPDQKIAWNLPELNDLGKPLFALRGVNPWGWHPFGIDLWNTDDYKQHIGQLAKLRMNFIGMHCYPEGTPAPEPTVWLGLPGDSDEQGRVTFSYPTRFFNAGLDQKDQSFSSQPNKYCATKTGEYRFGGHLLFDRDDWGPDILLGHTPRPATPEGCNEVFNRTGAMFHEAFGLARLLGVKTCLGTETPLTIPQLVKDKLKAQGKDSADPAVVREVYEGIFRRIAKTHSLDYYWLWTPEPWTWEGKKVERLQATVDDMKIAHQAIKDAGAPFRLAACGWVLGPEEDRAAFDKLLPKDIPLSALSRTVGQTPIEPEFAKVEGREKWAIPWLEDDMASVSPQLWVGRTRQDAADALAFGCTGLLGLQWRTIVLAPNVAALAQAGWDQSPWNPQLAKDYIASVTVAAEGPRTPARALPTGDFYTDWATALFGSEAAGGIASVFQKVDSRLPRPASADCPAGLRVEERPWPQVSPEYAFVDEIDHCRATVQGKGNLDRFDYWLNTFKYMRAIAKVECALEQFRQAMVQVDAEKDSQKRKTLAAERALPAYRQLLEAYREAYTHLLDTVSTNGCLATLMFWEYCFFPQAIDNPGRQLAAVLDASLPEDLRPQQTYQGRPRIIVPTVRTVLGGGESLCLKLIVLDNQPAASVVLLWRPLGRGEFQRLDAQHVARAVHRVELPSPGEDFEYYIKATTVGGSKLVWPATAPEMNQTVVIWKD